MAEKVVSYLRVSTARQGENGLGIEAQRAAVAALARERGWQLVGEHVEVESGARDDRPELAAALRRCRRARARLLVARLDRLSRDVEFIARVLKSGVEVTCCDLPGADRLTLHILAAVGENERRLIAARTRAAMQAAKARGRRFGSPDPRKGSRAGAREVQRAAAEHARNAAPIIAEIRRERPGLSARAVARELERRRVPTARGGSWGPGAVLNVERRARRLRSTKRAA